ncbi:hypothetical protein [Streptomyces sp. NRRL S-920]|uniref:hypothetical protein n=1 Tax=Streptomyces sp. NRRL S-920 TaxID=1463921 RepID=UPI0007C58338|nr:hypothetical protein [Streptomyces sp. NRRL S-920]
MAVSRVTLRVALVAALLTALTTLAACVPGLLAYAAESAPGGPLTTVDETPRAGSRPGEGRARPGRQDPHLPDPPPPPPPPTPPPAIPPPPPEPSPVTQHDGVSEATGPTPAGTFLTGLRVLPLGGGLVLIGLGLGFLGLRLRRAG